MVYNIKVYLSIKVFCFTGLLIKWIYKNSLRIEKWKMKSRNVKIAYKRIITAKIGLARLRILW